jgi:chromosome segregation ATPase
MRDAELAIQKAAEEMLNRQQLLLQSQNGSNETAKIKALEEELQHLTTRLKLIESELNDRVNQLSRQETLLNQKIQELAFYQQSHRADSGETELLRRRLLEEEQNRRELETELHLLIASRTKMALELEAAAIARVSTQLSPLQIELAEAQNARSTAEMTIAELMSEVEDLRSEIELLKKVQSDSQTIRLENHHMKAALTALRKGFSTSNPAYRNNKKAYVNANQLSFTPEVMAKIRDLVKYTQANFQSESKLLHQLSSLHKHSFMVTF